MKIASCWEARNTGGYIESSMADEPFLGVPNRSITELDDIAFIMT